MAYIDLNFNILDLNGIVTQNYNEHLHKKIEIKIESPTNQLLFPPGEYFKISQDPNVNISTLQVYVNGLLQTKDYHYTEVQDLINPNLGIGVNFTPDELLIDDIVVLEWVDEI